MAYQSVNRVIAGDSEVDKPWQKAVVRHLTEEMSASTDRPANTERESSSASDQPDVIAVIQRVGGLSITELDRTIHELQKVRGFLVSEGERMSREIAEYLKLTQAAITSTQAMSENIANFGSVVADAGKKASF